MKLKGKIIQLRFVKESDASKILEWENNDREGYVNLHNEKLSFKDVVAWILDRKNDITTEGELRFIIEIPEQHAVVGAIDLFDFDLHIGTVGVGIIVDIEHRRKGIASDSLKILLEYCFEEIGVKKVWCYIDEKNTSSLKLFLKSGFKLADKIPSEGFGDEKLYLTFEK
ncbi:MAG: GNAT family N-acetyltransferase [Bacteroidota bacterium]|jgi:diamine N-acetyltransferase